MPSYLQRLDDYSRYDRILQFVKLAGWDDNQTASYLFGLLPIDVQKQIQADERIGAGRTPNLTYMMSWAYQNPDQADPIWTKIFQEGLQRAGGHESELLSNPTLGQLYETQMKDKISKADETGWGRSFGNWTPRYFLQGSFDSTFGPGSGAIPNGTPQQQQNQQQQTGENPSMWNYLAPALAVGAPMALLGGLGGGGKAGLGLLGLATLGGLGYGYARQNGWIKGWEPLDNFANTVNSWQPVQQVTNSINGWINGGNTTGGTQQQTPPGTQPTTNPSGTSTTGAQATAQTTPVAQAPTNPGGGVTTSTTTRATTQASATAPQTKPN